MLSELSDQDRTQRDAIIAEITAAFKDVSRGQNGISWNETMEIDNWEPEDKCAAARLSDIDTHWSELVDSPDWQPFPGIGGFNFINTEGFLYYLPPTMIRFLGGKTSEWFPGHLLKSIDRFTESHLLSLWTESQLRSVARFIAFMARHDTELLLDPGEENPWVEAIRGRWGKYLPGSEA